MPVSRSGVRTGRLPDTCCRRKRAGFPYSGLAGHEPRWLADSWCPHPQAGSASIRSCLRILICDQCGRRRLCRLFGDLGAEVIKVEKPTTPTVAADPSRGCDE